MRPEFRDRRQPSLPFPHTHDRTCENCGAAYRIVEGQRPGVCDICTREEEEKRRRAIASGAYRKAIRP